MVQAEVLGKLGKLGMTDKVLQVVVLVCTVALALALVAVEALATAGVEADPIPCEAPVLEESSLGGEVSLPWAILLVALFAGDQPTNRRRASFWSATRKACACLQTLPQDHESVSRICRRLRSRVPVQVINTAGAIL